MSVQYLPLNVVHDVFEVQVIIVVYDAFLDVLVQYFCRLLGRKKHNKKPSLCVNQVYEVT